MIEDPSSKDDTASRRSPLTSSIGKVEATDTAFFCGVIIPRPARLFARLIFFGPLLIAFGGLVSLSDRRLRLATGRKAAPVKAGARA